MRFSGRIWIPLIVLTLIFSAGMSCKKDEEVPARPVVQPKKEPAPAPVKPRDVVLDGMYSGDFKDRLESLTIMATNSGVNLTGFQLQDDAARTRGSRQYLGITAEGRILDITRYLTYLSKGDIVFRVHKVKLKDIVKDRDSRRCKAEIILATYRHLRIPQDDLKTEDDAVFFLEGERERTKYLAIAIYEVDELSKKKDFEFKSFDYKCPEGEFTGVVKDREKVKDLKIWLADEYCFEKLEVKGIENYGAKSRKGSTGPALFTMNFKISGP